MIVGILKEIKAEENRVSMTSTIALTNAILPYTVEFANKGWKQASRENTGIKYGLNMMEGKVTYRAVAEAFGLEFVPVDRLL